MHTKAELIALLRAEFERWEALLAGLGEAQLVTPLAPSQLSIKDEIVHLWAWQQLSNARVDAARNGGEPVFPAWVGGQDPDAEEHLDTYNERIYWEYRDEPWSSVQQGWREGFLRLIAAGEALAEDDLLPVGRYPWLGEYALAAVLTGSQEHHEEHREQILERLQRQGSEQQG